MKNSLELKRKKRMKCFCNFGHLFLSIITLPLTGLVTLIIIIGIRVFAVLHLHKVMNKGYIGLIFGLIACIIVFIIGIIAFFKPIHCIHSLMLGVLIIFDVVLALLAFGVFGFRNSIVKSLANIYKKADNSTILTIESEFACCGYSKNNISERCKNSKRPTCYNRIYDIVNDYSIIVGSIILIIFILLSICIGIIFYQILKRNGGINVTDFSSINDSEIPQDSEMPQSSAVVQQDSNIHLTSDQL